MIKTLPAMLAALILSGCISPGPLTDREFLEQVLPVDHDTALANLRKGFGRCSSDYGQPSVVPFADRTVIDVYALTLLNRQTNETLGRIELYKEGEKVRMRSGIHRNYINGQRRENWLKWAVGDFRCEW